MFNDYLDIFFVMCQFTYLAKFLWLFCLLSIDLWEFFMNSGCESFGNCMCHKYLQVCGLHFNSFHGGF